MFLSKGNAVETVSARVKTLKTVLNSYISRKFTGRVAYRHPAEGVFISIEMVDGVIKACRGVAQGALYEGDSCCEEATKYLDRIDGSIEVVEIRADAIANDIMIFPTSKIEGETPLHRQLIAAQPSIIPAETRVAKEVEVLPVAPPPTRRERVVASGCIDEIQLYSILKAAQLILQTNNPLRYTDIEKMVGELQSRNPSYIYVSTTIGGRLLRILIDTASGIEYYQLETESGTVCGGEAHQQYLKGGLLNTRIWIA